MKLIVGLGNPGEKYERTRHNLGFMAVEQFLKDFEPVSKTAWINEPKFKSDIGELEWQSQNGTGLQKVILVKPKTYMNNSGLAVSLFTTYYKILVTDIWVVHDDIDLPFGSMKIRLGGAAGGHHGVESIIKHLNTDKFWRFRLGIGIQHGHLDDGKGHAISKYTIPKAEDYVLGNFIGKERAKLKDIIKRTSSALQMALEESLEVAQNRFNTK